MKIAFQLTATQEDNILYRYIYMYVYMYASTYINIYIYIRVTVQLSARTVTCRAKDPGSFSGHLIPNI